MKRVSLSEAIKECQREKKKQKDFLVWLGESSEVVLSEKEREELTMLRQEAAERLNELRALAQSDKPPWLTPSALKFVMRHVPAEHDMWIRMEYRYCPQDVVDEVLKTETTTRVIAEAP